MNARHALALTSLVAFAAFGTARAQQFVYVTNEDDDSVTVIDPGIHNGIPEPFDPGAQPHGVALSPDGTRAYIAGSAEIGGDVVGAIHVIDTATNQKIGSPIDTTGTAYALAVTPSGSHVYATTGSSNKVRVIRLQDGDVTEIDMTNAVSANTAGIDLSPDGSRAYVANLGGGWVDVIDTGTDSLVPGGPINVGAIVPDVAVHPGGRKLYATENSVGEVWVIDVEMDANTVVGDPIAVGSAPTAIDIAPNGELAYVALNGDDAVVVIDTATDTVVGDPIGVGEEPIALQVSHDGRRVYVVNNTGNSVSVIDTGTHTVIGNPIAVGAGPVDIAVGHGPDIDVLATDPANPQTIYAGTAGLGVWRSMNGGMTWDEVNDGLGGMHVTALALTSDGSVVYAGTRANGVFKSTDGGASWTAASSGLNPLIRSLQISPTNDLTIYAGIGEGGGIYRSTDGGANWEAVNGALP